MSDAATVSPIRAESVVVLAYEQIRGLIVSGELDPGERLGQVELAERLGISRTPVREALRRLAGEGLVEFHPNRGFWTTDLGLDEIVRRLEVRLLIEPGIAALAAERRTPEQLAAVRDTIVREERARGAAAVHDASRDFHLAVAHASGNENLANVIEAQWIVEVGRRLLARRRAAPAWQSDDVAEHRAIADAIEARDAARARRLMEEHIRDAICHWSPDAQERT